MIDSTRARRRKRDTATASVKRRSCPTCRSRAALRDVWRDSRSRRAYRQECPARSSTKQICRCSFVRAPVIFWRIHAFAIRNVTCYSPRERTERPVQRNGHVATCSLPCRVISKGRVACDTCVDRSSGTHCRAGHYHCAAASKQRAAASKHCAAAKQRTATSRQRAATDIQRATASTGRRPGTRCRTAAAGAPAAISQSREQRHAVVAARPR